MTENEKFMNEAIRLAKKAGKTGEVPIGAVVVKNGKIIGKGYNLREKKKNALLHGEIIAIDKACRRLHGWRLPGCTLYVTMEPCPMCAGAIVNSRIEKVVFGAYDLKAGCFGSVADFNTLPFNHKPEVYGGVCEEECRELLSDFFKKLRSGK